MEWELRRGRRPRPPTPDVLPRELLKGVKIFEIDLPGTQNRKKEKVLQRFSGWSSEI